MTIKIDKIETPDELVSKVNEIIDFINIIGINVMPPRDSVARNKKHMELVKKHLESDEYEKAKKHLEKITKN